MKKLNIVIACLFISAFSFAQPLNSSLKSTGKIILSSGQKIIAENSTVIEASLGMGMELNGTTIASNALDVKNSTASDYTISNTLTKLKVNINMMGQSNNYDSENKGANNEEMAKVFDNTLNSPVDIVIDNNTGSAVSSAKKQKKSDSEESNPAADMMSMFAANSDDAIVSAAFEMIPQGKKTGESWSDTVKTKEMKTITKYTLNSVTGNEATIQLDILATAVNNLEFQGMEFEIKTETKTKGEIIADITTGLTKKRTAISDISGSFQMMGQDMPISAKVTSTNTYK